MNQIRIAVIGTDEVGKTELLLSFCESLRVGDLLMGPELISSVPSFFVPKRTFYKTFYFDEEKVEVVFEEAGEEQLFDLRAYDACIFVYDVTDSSSFDVISDLVIPEEWKLENRNNQRYPVFLVGNKIDMLYNDFRHLRAVQNTQVLKWAWEKYIVHRSYETSIFEFSEQKENQILKNVFTDIIQQIFQMQRMANEDDEKSATGHHQKVGELDTPGSRLVTIKEISPSHDDEERRITQVNENLIQHQCGYENISIPDRLYSPINDNEDIERGERNINITNRLFQWMNDFCDNFCSTCSSVSGRFFSVLGPVRYPGKQGLICRKDYEEIKSSDRRVQMGSPHK